MLRARMSRAGAVVCAWVVATGLVSGVGAILPKAPAAALPSALQAEQRPGWGNAKSAAAASLPRAVHGRKTFGAACSDSDECASGMCCSSCSAHEGSCVCPCEDRGEFENRNGPWNGQWPVARCCCGTLSFGDRCINEDADLTRARGAACNFNKDQRPPYTTPVTSAPAMVRERALHGGRRVFGEPCHHYSECDSGICATGCDCDNGRLDVPQPCSCNCVTPRGTRDYTCGGFVVGVDPALKHCPPCDAATCTAHGSRPTDVCQYLCLSGEYAGLCHNYPPYFLGTPRCRSCCNLNMCPLIASAANLAQVFHASGGVVPASATAPAQHFAADQRDAFITAYLTRFPHGSAVAGDLLYPSGTDSEKEDIWTRDLPGDDARARARRTGHIV